MSAIDATQVWAIPRDNLDEKHEKCRNITEEIYKRIDITFQIKKLETGAQSEDDSDQSLIDSNELSNETDLFACDKSSISSSSEPLEPEARVNINNNEERKKAAAICRRPRKRFRKRVKKRPVASRSDSASSDSGAPLARMLGERMLGERPPPQHASSDRAPGAARVLGLGGERPLVPNIVIITKDAKPRIKTPERKPGHTKDKAERLDKATDKSAADKDGGGAREKASAELKACATCSLCFRGERGLRRHVNMMHFTPDDARKRDSSPG